jgi:histidyl-tRNA synthetase
LSQLGFSDFKLRLNHRQVLTGVLENAGVPLAQHDTALVAIDKLDKIGREGVSQELVARGIEQAQTDRLLNFFGELHSLDHAAELATNEDLQMKRTALNAAIVGRLVEFVGTSELGARGVDELRSIMRFAAAAGIAAQIEIDPTLARGLSYYTGAIMEISVKDLPGSLGGGGRYDNLVGMFLGDDVPACGFSLGLERILVVMTEREMFPPQVARGSAQVMVAIWNEDSIEDSVALAAELRREGLRVELYPEADKLGKQFKYASAREIPFVAVIGDDEKVRGEVALKNMDTGEQRALKREAIAKAIKS